MLRKSVSVVESPKFILPSRDFAKQYSNIYFHRLRMLRAVLTQRARSKYPNVPFVEKLVDLHTGEPCLLVGTIYKKMKLQPSLLKEYAEERAILPMPVKDSFTSDDDFLILEDEYGRVPLVVKGDGGALPVHDYVTGVVVAVHGEELEGGDFRVLDIIEPGVRSQPLRASLTERTLVALVSGLELGEGDAMKAELLIEFILSAPDVARVIVAGNIVATSAASAPREAASAPKTLSSRALSKLGAPVAAADATLARLCVAVPVDVMPGARDPASHALPQQPLSKCMLPLAARFTSLNCVTNPFETSFSGVRLLGTGGQTIDSLLRYVRKCDVLTAMRRCLRWRHIAPTAPDALACYPYPTHDPFVIESAPHVFFVGDQSEFETALVRCDEQAGAASCTDALEGTKLADADHAFGCVRVVRVPNFARTGTIVLLDLSTLAVEPVHFAFDF